MIDTCRWGAYLEHMQRKPRQRKCRFCGEPVVQRLAHLNRVMVFCSLEHKNLYHRVVSWLDKYGISHGLHLTKLEVDAYTFSRPAWRIEETPAINPGLREQINFLRWYGCSVSEISLSTGAGQSTVEDVLNGLL